MKAAHELATENAFLRGKVSMLEAEKVAQTYSAIVATRVPGTPTAPAPPPRRGRKTKTRTFSAVVTGRTEDGKGAIDAETIKKTLMDNMDPTKKGIRVMGLRRRRQEK